MSRHSKFSDILFSVSRYSKNNCYDTVPSIDEAVLEVSTDILPLQNMKHQQISILKGTADARADLTD